MSNEREHVLTGFFCGCGAPEVLLADDSLACTAGHVLRGSAGIGPDVVAFRRAIAPPTEPPEDTEPDGGTHRAA